MTTLLPYQSHPPFSHLPSAGTYKPAGAPAASRWMVTATRHLRPCRGVSGSVSHEVVTPPPGPLDTAGVGEFALLTCRTDNLIRVIKNSKREAVSWCFRSIDRWRWIVRSSMEGCS